MVYIKKNKKKIILLVFILLLQMLFASSMVFATEPGDVIIPSLELNFGQGTDNVASSIQILVLITILSLAPSILVMMTSFTRFIIVFSFLRKAISLQSTPPNQVLIALALFMTFFVMTPVFSDVIDNAYTPYVNQEISQEEALDNAVKPIKGFMLRQVRTEDLALFIDMSGGIQYEEANDIPITTVIPAFIISELKTGFQIGFLLFIPFIVIDMVVASTLMSLGMMMLPPVMISLPFKILLFIMVDGWHLLVEQLIRTIK
ncbi:MAG: flagellar type III secretion system pore protein FliP [Clostridiales bacterium]|nr:flagellar type III secretion system pore protein FliP [Clostridiales bacterium]